MKNILINLILSLVFTPVVFSQKIGFTWEKNHQGERGYLEAQHVLRTSDGGYAITGISQSNRLASALMKADADGNKQWLKVLGSDSVQMSADFSIEKNGNIISYGIIDPKGLVPPMFFKGFLFTFETNGSGSGDSLYYEYSQEGSLRYPGLFIPVSQNRILKAGIEFGAKDTNSINLRLTSDDTKLIWEKSIFRYPSTQMNAVRGVAEFENGYGIVATVIYDIPYVLFLRTDAEGKTIYEKKISGGDLKKASGITVTKDNGYALLTESSYKAPGTEKQRTDCVIYLFDAQNEKEFQHTITDTTVDFVFGNNIQQTHDGGFVIVGMTAMKTTDPNQGSVDFLSAQFFMRKIDATGKLQWHKSWGKENSMSILRYVLPEPDGNYIVGGVEGDEMYLAKIQETGTSVVEEHSQLSPLLSVSPNPVGAAKAEISYTVRASGATTITLLNALGQEMNVIVNQQLEPGSYSAFVSSDKLPNGVYFVRCTNGQYSSTQKLVIAK
jgi:hypothetical protein